MSVATLPPPRIVIADERTKLVEVAEKVVITQTVQRVTVAPEIPTVVVAATGPQGARGGPGATGSPGSGAVPFTIVTAGLDLGGGRFLHIRPDGTAIYADASAGLPAHGFTKVAVFYGDPVYLYNSDLLTNLTGLTPGATYWLSGIIPGLYTSTPPTSGFLQMLGIAASDDTLAVSIEPILQLSP